MTTRALKFDNEQETCNDTYGAATFRSLWQDGPGDRWLARPGFADGPCPGRGGRQNHADIAQGQDLEEAAAELKAAGIAADWIAADCSDEADIERLAKETVQRLGHVDILINNAGASWGAPAEDHPTSAWDKVMNLNVRGYFLLSQQIARLSMLERKNGRIINLASIAGLGGNPTA